MIFAEVTGINDGNKHSYHNKVKLRIFWIEKSPIITLWITGAPTSYSV